jgi:hypothetical protein
MSKQWRIARPSHGQREQARPSEGGREQARTTPDSLESVDHCETPQRLNRGLSTRSQAPTSRMPRCLRKLSRMPRCLRKLSRVLRSLFHCPQRCRRHSWPPCLTHVVVWFGLVLLNDCPLMEDFLQIKTVACFYKSLDGIFV